MVGLAVVVIFGAFSASAVAAVRSAIDRQLRSDFVVGPRNLLELQGFSPELESALRELTAGEREVVALRIVLDLDGDEVARLLGLTTTAVSTRLHRALGKLEERMTNP
jgi:RNA polymerase sigma factor (sigma-70 family)